MSSLAHEMAWRQDGTNWSQYISWTKANLLELKAKEKFQVK